jgi:hypothetical protein
MSKKETILIGFLVSAGMFSVAQAGQYVSQLSDVQKSELAILAVGSGTQTNVEPPRLVEITNHAK